MGSLRYNEATHAPEVNPVPLYEYRCSACGHRFEKIQSFSAPEQMECVKCGGTSDRLISAPAIQFKGSGFYLTDYGKAGASKGASEGGSSTEAKPGSDSKGSGEAGKPSTPAAAPSSTSASSSSTPASGSSASGS